jgi:hypothetical protein
MRKSVRSGKGSNKIKRPKKLRLKWAVTNKVAKGARARVRSYGNPNKPSNKTVLSNAASGYTNTQILTLASRGRLTQSRSRSLEAQGRQTGVHMGMPYTTFN